MVWCLYYYSLQLFSACATVNTVQLEIFAIYFHWRNFYPRILSCVNYNYIEEIATFTSLVEICNTKKLSLVKLLSSKNFLLYNSQGWALYYRYTYYSFEYFFCLVLEMTELTDFIEGHLEVLLSPKPTHQHSSIISDVYYLLADECLKSGDNQLSC